MDFSCTHFYKHMNGFYMHSICLPEKLTRQLTHLVGRLLELKGPNGRTWYVGLIRSGDKLILQPGWNDFASGNNISQNDHLVFKFVGEFKFEVFIFDPTGCEKRSTLLEREESQKEKELDHSLGSALGEELPNKEYYFVMEEIDELPQIQCEMETSVQKKKMPYIDVEQGQSEESKDSTPIEGEDKLPCKELGEKDNELSSDLLPIGELFRIKSQKNKNCREIQNETNIPPMKKHCKNGRKFPSTKSQVEKNMQFCYSYFTCKVPLTAEQNSRAQQLRTKVQAGNPYFHNIMKKYNLTSPYRLCIPSKFNADHLKRENLEFILSCDDKEKTWFVTSNFRSKRNEQVLYGPTWEKFIKENKLKLDDICLFELVKAAKRFTSTFVVHISRATNILDS